MAALLNFYVARDERDSPVSRVRWRPAIEFAGIVAGIWGAAGEIVVFLWTTLVLAFFGLVATGFLLA
jgi:hypothetical protein